MSSAVIFLVFLLCMFFAIPIAISITIASLLPSFAGSTALAATNLVRGMVAGVDSFTLLAIPMFVLSGIIMARGGVSKKLFEVFAFFLGKIPGGMPCAVIVTCLFYGAISGSAPATVAAVGSMTIPVLIELGYKKDFSVATVAVAGGLGVIIPPSIPFVLYGMVNPSASVGDMFTAGIVPGILIATCLMIYAVFYCVRNGEDKQKINHVVGELHQKGFMKIFASSFPALLSPIIILGSIYGGIASPTEAATISVFYALIVSMVIYRTIKMKDLAAIVKETVRTYGPLLFILSAASAFAKVLAILKVPDQVNTFFTENFSSPVIILIVVNVFLLIVGMLMDTGPAILLLTPILWPIMEGIGVNPIHFGIFMVVNLAIGFVTPPIGVNLFVASRLVDIPVMSIAKKAFPYIVLFLIALILIVSVPEISLCLL